MIQNSQNVFATYNLPLTWKLIVSCQLLKTFKQTQIMEKLQVECLLISEKPLIMYNTKFLRTKNLKTMELEELLNNGLALTFKRGNRLCYQAILAPVLLPQLFFIHINNFHSWLKHCNAHYFAYDGKKYLLEKKKRKKGAILMVVDQIDADSIASNLIATYFMAASLPNNQNC